MEEFIPAAQPEQQPPRRRPLELSESWRNLLTRPDVSKTPPAHEPPLTEFRPGQPESLAAILKRAVEPVPAHASSEKATPPTEVLQQVEKAADKNIPIEDRFERSHEIKDTPLITHAAPVASDDFTPADQPTLITPPLPITDQSDLLKELKDAQPPDVPKPPPYHVYRQAMTYGFLAALCLLLVAATFFVLK